MAQLKIIIHLVKLDLVIRHKEVFVYKNIAFVFEAYKDLENKTCFRISSMTCEGRLDSKTYSATEGVGNYITNRVKKQKAS